MDERVERLQVVVDFLDAWRYCPVASSSSPSRQCLEDAAAQLLAALDACKREHPNSSGVDLIAAERERQVSEEGWTPEHDDQHRAGELAMAAACYAVPYRLASGWSWPFEPESFKRAPVDAAPVEHVRDLVKAGALIAAEIDRLLRAAPESTEQSDESQETLGDTIHRVSEEVASWPKEFQPFRPGEPQGRDGEPFSPKRAIELQPLGEAIVTGDPFLVHLALRSRHPATVPYGETMTPAQARELAELLVWAAGETERRKVDGDGNVTVGPVEGPDGEDEEELCEAEDSGCHVGFLWRQLEKSDESGGREPSVERTDKRSMFIWVQPQIEDLETGRVVITRRGTIARSNLDAAIGEGVGELGHDDFWVAEVSDGGYLWTIWHSDKQRRAAAPSEMVAVSRGLFGHSDKRKSDAPDCEHEPTPIAVYGKSLTYCPKCRTVLDADDADLVGEIASLREELRIARFDADVPLGEQREEIERLKGALAMLRYERPFTGGEFKSVLAVEKEQRTRAELAEGQVVERDREIERLAKERQDAFEICVEIRAQRNEARERAERAEEENVRLRGRVAILEEIHAAALAYTGALWRHIRDEEPTLFEVAPAGVRYQEAVVAFTCAEPKESTDE